jgi:uncharacterized protein (DUF1778 family)
MALRPEQPRQVPGGRFNPFAAGQRVGAEGFEVALLSVVEQRPMEPDQAGLRVVNEAGGIVGAQSGFDLCATWGHIPGMTATMTQRRPQKRERLVARVTVDDKAVIAHAAALAGQSVGSFVVAEARKAALQTIETCERIVLNAEESRRFVEALLAPPRPPTERMKRSLKLYRKTVISDV